MSPMTSRSRSVSASGPCSGRPCAGVSVVRRSASKITAATAGERLVPRRQVAHRARQLVGVEAAVDQVAVGSGADRADDHRLVVGVGQHHHLEAAGEASRGLDAVHHRHADVQEHHVGLQALGEVDRFASGGGLADDLDVVGLRLEQRADAAAYDGVVVGDENADHGTTS